MKYRKATFADIEAIFALVNDYAGDGVMLARSRNTLYETLRDMIVAEDDAGEIVGVGGLHILWDRLAEIRTMAVSPRLTRHGIDGEGGGLFSGGAPACGTDGFGGFKDVQVVFFAGIQRAQLGDRIFQFL